MQRIEQLLLRMVGLHPDAIGRRVLERAVAERMRASDAPNLEAYHARLLGSVSELQNLVEEVVVPETWFFRDPAAFGALAEWATGEWMKTHPGGVLRLLSLPCSTGEEPYTMAMALLDAGFPAERLRIDAVDISDRSLARAEAGVYRQSSFRTADLGFRDRYFRADRDGYRIDPSIRALVSFRQGNLQDPGFIPPRGEYDAVYCRNLLIYLDAKVQENAVRRLTSLVDEDGLFFVGAAETHLMRGRGFSSVGRPMSFAFRRSKTEGRGARGGPTRSPSRPAIPPNRRLRGPHPPAWSPPRVPAAFSAPAKAPATLDRAERLAGEGRLAEARDLCEAAILEGGSSARALHILGVVRGAQGDSEAADRHLRQALYLDPYHEETLLHLALMAIQRGSGVEAGRLLERARHAGTRAAASGATDAQDG